MPDALIGDYYFIQNVVRTIQASGTECWTDITTDQTTCSGVIVSVTPTPVPQKPGDVNGDGKVSISDLSLVLSNFGSTSATRAQGDLTGDGKVTISDLSQVLSAFGTIYSS